MNAESTNRNINQGTYSFFFNITTVYFRHKVQINGNECKKLKFYDNRLNIAILLVLIIKIAMIIDIFILEYSY